jgi:uncharacterized membrane protein
MLWFLARNNWCYVVGACWIFIAGAILIWNLLAGSTYVVKIQTAAQTRRLKAVERAGKYQAFTAIVVPLIMAEQQPNQASALAP